MKLGLFIVLSLFTIFAVKQVLYSNYLLIVSQASDSKCKTFKKNIQVKAMIQVVGNLFLQDLEYLEAAVKKADREIDLSAYDLDSMAVIKDCLKRKLLAQNTTLVENSTKESDIEFAVLDKKCKHADNSEIFKLIEKVYKSEINAIKNLESPHSIDKVYKSKVYKDCTVLRTAKGMDGLVHFSANLLKNVFGGVATISIAEFVEEVESSDYKNVIIIAWIIILVVSAYTGEYNISSIQFVYLYYCGWVLLIPTGMTFLITTITGTIALFALKGEIIKTFGFKH
jgi:uncharacterized integral membrane protein